MTETSIPATPVGVGGGAPEQGAPPPAPAVPSPVAPTGDGPKVPRRRRAQVDVDWTLSHGAVSGPVNVAGGAAAVAMLAEVTGTSPVPVAVGAAALGLAAAVRSRRRQRTGAGALYRCAAGAGTGWWIWWATATTSWPSMTALSCLAAGAGTFGLIANPLGHYEDETAQLRHDAAIARERVEVAVEWEKRIERVTRVKCKVTDVETWPGEGGMTLAVQLPPGGATRRTLAEHADRLAADADLPAGCQIQVAPGKTRGAVFLRVQVVDRTAEDQPYRDDGSTLSMTGPLPIGVRSNGSLRCINILEDPVLVAARIGSGKTTFLDVVIADLVRCTDAIVWAIDLNGGGMTMSWLQPWLDGRTKRPALDWVATTPEEALTMLETAIKICKERKHIYRSRMRDANVDKLNIGVDVPGIVIVFDEAAEAVAMNRGNKAIADKLDALMAIARAMRVRVVMTALRAESSTVPTAVKQHAGTKIVLRPEDEGEVANLLGWGLRGLLVDVAKPGMALIRDAEAPTPEPIKIMMQLPRDKEQIAVAYTATQPDIDAPSRRVGGSDYDKRWDRYRAWARSREEDDGMDVPQHEPVGDDVDGDPTTVETGADMTDKPDGPPSLEDAFQGMQMARDRMKEIRDRHEREQRNKGGDAEIDPNLIADLAAGSTRQEWIVDILRGAGRDGMHWQGLLTDLADHGHEISRATLYRDLDALVESGTVERGDDDGVWRLRR